MLPLVVEVGEANLLTAAFRLDVKALSTAAVSESVVAELEVLEVGLISWSKALVAVELKLALSVLEVLAPKSAVTSWPAMVDPAILLSCSAEAPFSVLAARLEGSRPSLYSCCTPAESDPVLVDDTFYPPSGLIGRKSGMLTNLRYT